MTELTPGDGVDDELQPDAEGDMGDFARGVKQGRWSMKTDVLLAIGGCLDRDPSLQKLVQAIEELK